MDSLTYKEIYVTYSEGVHMRKMKLFCTICACVTLFFSCVSQPFPMEQQETDYTSVEECLSIIDPIELINDSNTFIMQTSSSPHFFDIENNNRTSFTVISIPVEEPGIYEFYVKAMAKVMGQNRSVMFPLIKILDSDNNFVESEISNQGAVPPGMIDNLSFVRTFQFEIVEPGIYKIFLYADMSSEEGLTINWIDTGGSTYFQRSAYSKMRVRYSLSE